MRVDSLYTRLPRHGLIATGRLQPCRAVRNSAQQLSQLVFPHNDSILVEGKDVSCERLIELLSPTTSDERLRKMQQVGPTAGQHQLTAVTAVQSHPTPQLLQLYKQSQTFIAL